MRPLHLPVLVSAAALLAAGAAGAQTPDTHAGHGAPASSAHAGHNEGMEMKGMAMPAMTMPGSKGPQPMSGMDMSGGDMGGMKMAGMEPPAPRPPPPGPRLQLDAAAPTVAPNLASSPGQITLAFGRPVTLREIVLTNAVGQQTPIHTSLPEAAVESFTFPVTIPLSPGNYHVAWDAAEPGPLRRGRLAFGILQADGTASPAAPAGHQHHH